MDAHRRLTVAAIIPGGDIGIGMVLRRGDDTLQAVSSPPVRYSGAGRPHPSLYARIRALSHFSESEDFLKLAGKKGGKPQTEVDAEVEKDLHATLDYYAGKLMDDVIGAVNNHLAAAQLHFEGK